MATNEELPELLKPNEVCSVLRISRPHLLRLTEQGLLNYVDLGPQTRRFRRADVESLAGLAQK